MSLLSLLEAFGLADVSHETRGGSIRATQIGFDFIPTVDTASSEIRTYV
jgi:hypothetical protein